MGSDIVHDGRLLIGPSACDCRFAPSIWVVFPPVLEPLVHGFLELCLCFGVLWYNIPVLAWPHGLYQMVLDQQLISLLGDILVFGNPIIDLELGLGHVVAGFLLVVSLLLFPLPQFVLEFAVVQIFD